MSNRICTWVGEVPSIPIRRGQKAPSLGPWHRARKPSWTRWDPHSHIARPVPVGNTKPGEGGGSGPARSSGRTFAVGGRVSEEGDNEASRTRRRSALQGIPRSFNALWYRKVGWGAASTTLSHIGCAHMGRGARVARGAGTTPESCRYPHLQDVFALLFSRTAARGEDRRG